MGSYVYQGLYLKLVVGGATMEEIEIVGEVGLRER